MAGTTLIRQHAIELFQQNMTQTEIAARLGVSRVTISQWWKIYKGGGADALLQRGQKGRARRLTEERRREIASWLAASPQDQGLTARRWTGRELAILIRRKFGVVHSPNYCLAMCRAMGVPVGGAYRPPRQIRRSTSGVRGRPPKISGAEADRLRADLLLADQGRSPRGWTRQEVVDFVRQRAGVEYSADSVSDLLGRLGVTLQIIPEWQRRIEMRPRPPKLPQHGRRLTAEQVRELHNALKGMPDIAGWSAERVKSFIWKRFRVRYSLTYVPHLLQQLGIWIRRPSPRKSRGGGTFARKGTRSPRR